VTARCLYPWTSGCRRPCADPEACSCELEDRLARARARAEADALDATPVGRDRRLAREAGVPPAGEIP
jgi:hypothetical protein